MYKKVEADEEMGKERERQEIEMKGGGGRREGERGIGRDRRTASRPNR